MTSTLMNESAMSPVFPNANDECDSLFIPTLDGYLYMHDLCMYACMRTYLTLLLLFCM